MSTKWEDEFPNLDKLADTIGRLETPSGLGIDRDGLSKEIRDARAIIGAAQKIPGVKFTRGITGPAIDITDAEFFTGPAHDDDICPTCKRPL